MSRTITLPVSFTDPFSHGHSPSTSKSSTRHGRPSARLAPPFALPRIPSESLTQQSARHQGPDHLNHERSSNPSIYTSPTPHSDLERPLASKKRSFEVVKMAGSHDVYHNHRRMSKPTEILLHKAENFSLIRGIIANHDSRRILYFMILNLAFMVVQSTYGYLTGSLGLISDSIHMFFDCVALFVGLCAAVMSKWDPSPKFPYGYGKIDTLAGLGNGIFLMLISIEIVYEAIERLFTSADVSRTTELLVVSSMGLVVNLVGIFAFHGHHHHGHDHTHAHTHENQHERMHSHASSHRSDKGSDSSIFATANGSPSKVKKDTPHAHGHHHHGHGSENMEGIYLHIMADALGSVAVVISTLLVKFTDWSGWDPIASCIIAVLIFISTIPLVVSTTKTLLLSLNSDIEYNLRDVLSGVNDLRGVVGYTVPKFWLEDVKESDHGHSHDHSHTANHSHSHDHHNDHSHAKCHDNHSRHDHSHSGSDASCHEDEGPMLQGVIHIVASQSADLVDVRKRVSQHFQKKKIDVVVQIEREGEGRCFCSGAKSS